MRLAEKRREKGDHRARRNPRRQRIQHKTRLTRRIIHPFKNGRPVTDMPVEPALARNPVFPGIPLVPLRDAAQMRLGQRNDPAATAITGGKPGLGLQLGNFRFQRYEGIELELLLVRPAVRHMRHQGAKQPAACSTAKLLRLHQQSVYSEPFCLDGGP